MRPGYDHEDAAEKIERSSDEEIHREQIKLLEEQDRQRKRGAKNYAEMFEDSNEVVSKRRKSIPRLQKDPSRSRSKSLKKQRQEEDDAPMSLDRSSESEKKRSRERTPEVSQSDIWERNKERYDEMERKNKSKKAKKDRKPKDQTEAEKMFSIGKQFDDNFEMDETCKAVGIIKDGQAASDALNPKDIGKKHPPKIYMPKRVGLTAAFRYKDMLIKGSKLFRRKNKKPDGDNDKDEKNLENVIDFKSSKDLEGIEAIDFGDNRALYESSSNNYKNFFNSTLAY